MEVQSKRKEPDMHVGIEVVSRPLSQWNVYDIYELESRIDDLEDLVNGME